MSTFRRTIEEVINCHCKENESNTPDFILANYLCNCLDAFTLATKSRDKWYSVNLEPCNSHFIEEAPTKNQGGDGQHRTTNAGQKPSAIGHA